MFYGGILCKIMKLTEKKLLELNRLGLFPSPEEDEETFLSRIIQGGDNQEIDWHGVSPMLKKLFDFQPQKIRVEYSKKKLRFWEGAALWVDEKKRALIRLHPRLKKGDLYGFYRRDEILSHEAVHAVRAAFKEPLFEEVLAYRTSRSPLRKWLGPIFASPRESLFFLISLVVSFMGFMLDVKPLYIWIPVGLLSLNLIRLAYAHHALRSCMHNLEPFLKEGVSPLAVPLRLTDKEIRSFANWSFEKIFEYVHDQKSLRWKTVTLSYFHSLR